MAANRILGLIIGACIAASLPAPTLAQSPTLKSRAEQGDAAAQYEYAQQLYNAGGASREEARVWMTKAADAGVPGAIYWMGYAGWGTEKPIVYYKKAADLGHAAAFRALFGSLLNAGADTDTVAAKKYADLAREKQINLDHYQQDFLVVIDACYRAGPANMAPLNTPSSVDMDEYYRIEDYANGRGVPRDPKKALALACQDNFMAAAEMTSIVKALEEGQTASTPTKTFVFCNHATSGAHMLLCTGEREDSRQAQRQRDFDALSASWAPDQALALRTLQTAAEAYFDGHVQNERFQGFLSSHAIGIDEVADLRQSMLDSLKAFEAGRFPPHDDFAKADRELNTTYRALLARKEWEDSLAVSPSKPGIRNTERLWIVYRDAWVALGAARYPQTAADDWKAWLTRARTKELVDVGGYLDFQ